MMTELSGGMVKFLFQAPVTIRKFQINDSFLFWDLRRTSLVFG